MMAFLRVSGESSTAAFPSSEIAAVKYVTQGSNAGTLEVSLQGKAGGDKGDVVCLSGVTAQAANRFIDELGDFIITQL